MDVLVDTPVWSLAFRRPRFSAHAISAELERLIRLGSAFIAGPTRQELLSGIKSEAQFKVLRNAMRAFPDLKIETEDYEEAAFSFNQCRSRGVQASHIDFLLCAMAKRRRMSIFTTDRDFERLESILHFRLHQVET